MSTTDEPIPQNSAVYERPDTDAGFITDANEIMQLKAIRKSDIINSELLGEFDEYGVYEIDQQIVVELVRLPKRITQQNEFGTFAEAVVEDKVFHFRMLPTKEIDNKLVSQLELLEEVFHANGYIIDTRTTLLATYSLEPVSNFEEIAKSVFHLTTHPDDDDFGGDEGDGNAVLKPKNAEYIKHRLAYLKAMGLVSSGLYEKLEEAYFNKRIKILNSVPEGAIVLAEYKKQFEKIEHFFVNNSKNKYRAMNDLLTSIIEGPKGEKLRRNDAYRIQMKEANRIYLKTVHQIDESVKKSMEVIDALSKTMPIKQEFEDIKTKNMVVAKKKDEQKKNETNSFSKKSSGDRPRSKKSGGGGKPSSKKSDKKDKKDNKKDNKTWNVGGVKLLKGAGGKTAKQEVQKSTTAPKPKETPKEEKKSPIEPLMPNLRGETGQVEDNEGDKVVQQMAERQFAEKNVTTPPIQGEQNNVQINPGVIVGEAPAEDNENVAEILNGLR